MSTAPTFDRLRRFLGRVPALTLVSTGVEDGLWWVS